MTLEEVSYLGVPGVSQETQFLYKKIDSILNGIAVGINLFIES